MSRCSFVGSPTLVYGTKADGIYCDFNLEPLTVRERSCWLWATGLGRPSQLGSERPADDGGWGPRGPGAFGPGNMGRVTIRVFLLDDHELVREGIRTLLESDQEIEVVGEAATGADALTRIPLATPDVAILDVRLEEGNGIEVCRDVRSAVPGMACLILTSFADDEALYASVMAGASGFILKQIKARDLIEDVKKVAGGASLMDPRGGQGGGTDRQPSGGRSCPEFALPQERRVLDLIAEGKTNKQIAEEMFLAEHTVKNYITGLLRKLRMASRTEAAIFATKLKAEEGTAAPD